MYSRYRDKPDPSEVRKILIYLNYNDREMWYKVFCVLGRDYQHDHEIFAIAQEWSSQYPHRTAADRAKERTEFFNSSQRDGAHIGTLILEAKKNGYVVPREYETHVQQALNDARKSVPPVSPVLQPPAPDDDSGCARFHEIMLKSCAITKYWLYIAGDDKMAARVTFLNDSFEFFRYMPEGPRCIMEAMHEYCRAYKSYSYNEFTTWLQLQHKPISQDAFNMVLSSATATSEEQAYDFLNEVADLGFQSQLIEAGESLKKYAPQLRGAQLKAFGREIQEALTPISEGKNNDKELWPDDVNAMCIERTDDELAMNHFVPSGYKVIDDHIMGLHRGGVTLLAAYSGIGKTWVSLDMSIRLLRTHPQARVLYISSEMSVSEIEFRIFALVNNVSILTQDLKRYRASGEWETYMQRFNNFCHSDRAIKLIGADRKAITIDDIEAAVASASAKGRLDLVVVDYLQNIQGAESPNKNSANHERVLRIMQRLCTMAKREQCAVLALSQLINPNRKGKDNAPPGLNDLAESSYIVHAADAVLVMYQMVSSRKDKSGGDIGGVGPSFYDERQGNLFAGTPEAAAAAAAVSAAATAAAGGSGVAATTGAAMESEANQLFGEDRFFNDTDLLLSVCKSRNGMNTSTPLKVRRSAGSRFSFEF